MIAVCRFVTKFASLIVCTLHCFDRVILKVHLPVASATELERFVDWVLKVRRAHFLNVLAPEYSERLVLHAQALARKAGRTYQYRTGSFKERPHASYRVQRRPFRAAACRCSTTGRSRRKRLRRCVSWMAPHRWLNSTASPSGSRTTARSPHGVSFGGVMTLAPRLWSFWTTSVKFSTAKPKRVEASTGVSLSLSG
jgi:hypothetical protein